MTEARARTHGSLHSCLVFARALLRHPGRLGAVAPSGTALSHLITAAIAPRCAPVIELGPGTGVFTRALLKRGVPEDKIALVECDPAFADTLSLQFPSSRVLRLDASHLPSVELFGGELAGAVISGLPLLSMSRTKVIAILSGSFSHLRDGGVMYQFTYGPRCPVPRPVLDQLDLESERIGFTWSNLPPASVFCIRRRRSATSPVRNRLWSPALRHHERSSHSSPAIVIRENTP